VYTVRVSDGQGLTRVTSNPGGIDAPVAYSPDGRLLLFARTPAGAGESSAKTALFVTPARGGKATRITPLGYTDDAAAWSPDGRSIVFETFGSLFRVRPDGTGLRKIAVTTTDGTPLEHTFDVDYSPDGSSIVFSVAGAEPGPLPGPPRRKRCRASHHEPDRRPPRELGCRFRHLTVAARRARSLTDGRRYVDLSQAQTTTEREFTMIAAADLLAQLPHGWGTRHPGGRRGRS
jgi:dipeptidyl aminopeptidase/acylaminoacyl peptidase